MPISHKYKLIFIHIPKCAGVSITNSLELKVNMDDLISESMPALQHLLPKQLKETYIDKEKWDSYKKFTIIRNPYDRVVSDYFWMKGNPDASRLITDSFDDFLTLREDVVKNNRYDEDLYFDHFYPMHFYFEGIIYDHVIRFENIGEQYEEMRALYNIEMTLPKINESEKKGFILSKSQHDRIYKLYKKDFIKFGYSKELSLSLSQNDLDKLKSHIYQLEQEKKVLLENAEASNSLVLNLKNTIEQLSGNELILNKELETEGIKLRETETFLNTLKETELVLNRTLEAERNKFSEAEAFLNTNIKTLIETDLILSRTLEAERNKFNETVTDLRDKNDFLAEKISDLTKISEIERSVLEEKLLVFVDANAALKKSLESQSHLVEEKTRETDRKVVASANEVLVEQNKIVELQNTLNSKETELRHERERSKNLEQKIVTKTDQLAWYHRTFIDRKLAGIIKDRFLKVQAPRIELNKSVKRPFNYFKKFWEKEKVLKAEIKTKVGQKTMCAIVNYNCNENALKLRTSLSKYFDTVVFDSGSKDKNKNFVLLDNVYYSGLFNSAYEYAVNHNYEYMFFICSDVEMQNDQIEIMINNLNTIDISEIGIYSPSSTGRSHHYCKKQNEQGLRIVPFAEGFVFLAHLDVLKNIAPIDLAINKYGWGLDVAKGFFAKKLNKLCVIDDGVTVYHPEGTGYSDEFAEEGMWKWMDTFKDSDFKNFYTKQIDIIRRGLAGQNKISVIIPCYNQEAYIKETVYSILFQEYSNFEILLINDGSTDNTEKLSKDLCSRFNQIKYISKPNGGLGNTRNLGLQEHTGDFVQFLDSDDIISKNKFLNQVYDFILDPELQISYSEYLCFEDGDKEKFWTYSRLIMNEDPVLDLIKNWETELSIPVHCFLFNASILEKERFDEELPNHEDWDFHLKIASHKPKYKYQKDAIAFYRVRTTSMSRDKELMIKGKNMCIQKAIDSKRFSNIYLQELHNRNETVYHPVQEALSEEALSDFEIRAKREMEIYNKVHEDGGDRVSIPGMATYWSSRYLSSRLREVFGEADINELYVSEIVERAGLMGHSGPITCLSLGSGDCIAEFDIVQKVIGRGVDIRMTCTDLNPALMEISEQKAKEIGLSKNFNFKSFDINTQFPNEKYDIVIVSHALHHFIELDKIFTNVFDQLNEGGCFIVSDMIGRNGHMRWPEALKYIELLWKLIPEEKKLNGFTKVIDEPYINFDCSTGNFEGICAQDIMPLLLKHFDFEKFVGLGGLVDIFTDRVYGNNFYSDNNSDKLFIDFVEELNSRLIDSGELKPTAMFGTLVKKSKDPKVCLYSRWSPEFCLRVPD